MKTYKNGLISILDPIKLLQTLLTHLLLLLSYGLFSRGEWNPALLVFVVYIVTLSVIAVGPLSAGNVSRG